jgi:hypothetical protein
VRPAGGWSFDVAVGDPLLENLAPHTAFPYILRPAHSSVEASGTMQTEDSPVSSAHISVVRNPSMARRGALGWLDMQVECTMKPVELVYAPEFLNQLRQIFTGKRGLLLQTSDLELPYNVAGDETQGSSTDASFGSRVSAWREERAQAILSTLTEPSASEEHQTKQDCDVQGTESGRWLVNLSCHAPVVLFPEDHSLADSPLVVADLGHLHLQTANTNNSAESRMNESQSKAGADVEPPATPGGQSGFPRRSLFSSEDMDDEFQDCENIETNQAGENQRHSQSKTSQPAHQWSENLNGETWELKVSDVCLFAAERASLYRLNSLVAPCSDQGSMSSLEPVLERFTVAAVCRSLASTSPQQSAVTSIEATLPRLAVVLRSTTYKQLLRLQSVLSKSNDSDQTVGPTDSRACSESKCADRDVPVTPVAPPKGKNQELRLRFYAPLVLLDIQTEELATVRLAARRHKIFRGKHQAAGLTDDCHSTILPLIHASLEGFSYSFSSATDFNGDSTARGSASKTSTTEVAIRALHVEDCFQSAGPSFSGLISSRTPERLRSASHDSGAFSLPERRQVPSLDRSEPPRFVLNSSGETSPLLDDEALPLVLLKMEASPVSSHTLLSFDSLFFEWNPETIIAIHDFMSGAKNRTEGPASVAAVSNSAMSSGTHSSPTTTLTPTPTQLGLTVDVTLRCVAFSFNKEAAAVHLAIARIDDARVQYLRIGGSYDNKDDDLKATNHLVTFPCKIHSRLNMYNFLNYDSVSRYRSSWVEKPKSLEKSATSPLPTTVHRVPSIVKFSACSAPASKRGPNSMSGPLRDLRHPPCRTHLLPRHQKLQHRAS